MNLKLTMLVGFVLIAACADQPNQRLKAYQNELDQCLTALAIKHGDVVPRSQLETSPPEHEGCNDVAWTSIGDYCYDGHIGPSAKLSETECCKDIKAAILAKPRKGRFGEQ